MTHFKSSRGFTLVELAISLAIIGLLLGGVLKGDELLRNARVTQTVKQLQDFRGAVANFRNAYDAWPGDMADPNTRLPNCTASPCYVAAVANGNNLVESNTTPWAHNMNASNNSNFSAGTEAGMFWQHLGASGMSTIEYSPRATAINVPKTPMGGTSAFVAVAVASIPASGRDIYGNYFGLFGVSGTTTQFDIMSSNNGAVSGPTAEQIDRKMDDANPEGGDVRAATAAGSNACYTGTTYYQTQTASATSCGLLIRMEK